MSESPFTGMLELFTMFYMSLTLFSVFSYLFFFMLQYRHFSVGPSFTYLILFSVVSNSLLPFLVNSQFQKFYFLVLVFPFDSSI